ncbi:hypothetical protein GCM10011507_09550 [Edaphobacter acidisoli]|uniref:Fibronectin type-III domain-containing protein n=1 Tax=Edaphobacter acidisoli TaxID=2040573 RepID=A0A916RKJ4_9BACT|nr:hypothetical protein GCM10011507_09550 [Edaphobacter acidisoli]
MDFGTVAVGESVDSTVSVTNAGDTTANVTQVSIAGGSFSLVGGDNTPIAIPSGGTYAVKVAFTPSAASDYSGQLTMLDASAKPVAEVKMKGSGKGHQPGTTAAANPQLTVSTASLSFGSVTVGSATTQPVTLTSTGTTAVTVNAAAITGGGYSIVGGSFPVTLNPSQSLTVQVQFDPSATGSATGQLTITSNSSTGSTAGVTLSGTGTAAANPQLTVSTASLSFGSVTVGSATTQPVTLTSTGTTAVTVNAAAITGGGYSIVGGSFPVTLNPSQSLTVQVQFDPSATGSATGQLTITSNSSTGSTAGVTLSGTGTAAAHEVDLSWTAPTTSTDPVAGYHIYRSSGSGVFALINSGLDVPTAYADNTVVSGATYTYYVTSVDYNGIESDPSNQASFTIP